MGIEPTWDFVESHAGFEDQERHQNALRLRTGLGPVKTALLREPFVGSSFPRRLHPVSRSVPAVTAAKQHGKAKQTHVSSGWPTILHPGARGQERNQGHC